MTEKNPPYLPKWATTAEAGAYLEEVTGEAWPLVRLLDSWLTPSIWLEYSPDAPPELFGDRTEGIFAPLCFANDIGRMAHTRSGLLTMSKLPDGRLFRVSPGIPFDLAELRYSRADLLRLVQGHEPQEDDTQHLTSSDEQKRGITARAILAHPWPVPDGVDLKSLLSDGRAKWLAPAVSRGSPGKAPSLWNPAILAICMESASKGKTWKAEHHRLNKFIREHFDDWVDEWERLCEYRE